MDESFDGFDAADALFNRGAFLRKLREMEAQDEAERQAELEANNFSVATPSDTLHYDSFLNGQNYYDDYKHVNYRFIDFGYIAGGREEDQDKQLPLLIEQDRSVGKGGFIWDAGVILAEHVIHEKNEWEQLSNSAVGHNRIKMVELGAGTGTTGLMVAQALPNDVTVGLTDLPLLMPLLEKNLQNNNNPPNASAFVLEWGGSVSANYDVILGADVVAGIYDPYLLAKTIFELCHDKSIVYLAINARFLEPISQFESAMSKLFDCVQHRPAVSRNKNPNVSILVATGKRSNQ
jgi:hypothetical protein